MAKTPDAAIKLLSDLVPAATAQARREADKLQVMINKQHGGFKLAPWDWQYYAEQVRKADYALDEAQLKPYFELDRVLEDGVFFAANRLYGLTFKRRTDLPVYHPDVRVFEVFDADGTSIALWYCDYFKRDNKSGGAWEDTFVDGSGLLGTKPVVFNVANFTKPAPGQPALLRFDDVKTMFHEFGHALHAMLTRVEYPRLTGTNVPTDFVEFPSQFNEHWALEPTVLAHYAKHYQTGQPMPRALVDKIRRARTFDQGFATTEYVAAALLDMAWHTLPVGPQQPDVDAFEAQALKRFAVDVPEVPPRYRTSYFAHIWNGGYYAGYYAYLWSEALDDDAYAWVTEHGGMTRANGPRFRDIILSRGGPGDMGGPYRAFRGRDPEVGPVLAGRGRLPPELRPPHVHGLAQGRLPQSPERGPRDGYASSARHPARRLHDAPAGEHRADAVARIRRKVQAGPGHDVHGHAGCLHGHGEATHPMVPLLSSRGDLRRVRRGKRAAPGRELPRRFPLRGPHRVRGVHPRAVADVDLVPSLLDHHDQSHGGWADLRAPHGGRLRMAVAPLIPDRKSVV